VLLRGLGGLTLAHVVGCAAAEPPGAKAPVGRATPPRAPEREPAHAPEPTTSPPPSAVSGRHLRLPARPSDAESGTAFLARIEPLEKEAFEQAIYEAVAGGNVPRFQRELLPVEVHDDDNRHRARLHVLCDYLAIGSDDDFLRMPMTASTAQRIATLLDCVLPTKKLVDAIYRQAPAKLPPSFIQGGPDPSDHQDYLFHNAELEAHRARRRLQLGALTAGNKKDIVLTDRLVEKSDRVAIYGWHRDDGTPIQPLSTLHGRRYADYSHGVRLVDQRMTIDEADYRVEQVLQDPALASLLSDEGPLEVVSYPTWLPPPQPRKGRGAPQRRRTAKRKSGS
jgi:hypothetical protein